MNTLTDSAPLSRIQARQQLVALFLSESFENVPLSERRLAKHLGLGRTPVREALQELTREGIVESSPTGNTTLRRMSLDDLRELYEVRIALEGTACMIAAGSKDHSGLSRILDRLRADGALDIPDAHLPRVQETGNSMHQEILRISGNGLLRSLHETLSLRIRICLGISRDRAPDRIRQTVQDHIDIAQAILAGEGERARALMTRHLEEGLALRTALFASRTSRFSHGAIS